MGVEPTEDAVGRPPSVLKTVKPTGTQPLPLTTPSIAAASATVAATLE